MRGLSICTLPLDPCFLLVFCSASDWICFFSPSDDDSDGEPRAKGSQHEAEEPEEPEEEIDDDSEPEAASLENNSKDEQSDFSTKMERSSSIGDASPTTTTPNSSNTTEGPALSTPASNSAANNNNKAASKENAEPQVFIASCWVRIIRCVGEERTYLPLDLDLLFFLLLAHMIGNERIIINF